MTVGMNGAQAQDYPAITVTREAQDEYALQSQQRIATAQAEGRFDGEIAPITTIMKVVTDRETGCF